MAPVNRALFPRRNFTNLIDRGERIREMIDFLLRCAPVAPSPCLFRVLCFLTDGTTLPRHCRAAIDRVRTNARSKTYTAEFIIYAIGRNEGNDLQVTHTCTFRCLTRRRRRDIISDNVRKQYLNGSLNRLVVIRFEIKQRNLILHYSLDYVWKFNYVKICSRGTAK